MPTRPDTLQGSLPLLVLTVLHRRGPLHGYAITSHIHSLSDALRVEEGSLYPSLHRMEEAGWIKARTITTEHNRRARAYEITAAGRRQLGMEASRQPLSAAFVLYGCIGCGERIPRSSIGANVSAVKKHCRGRVRPHSQWMHQGVA